MASLARAIGKGLRGAAAVAVPMAFEAQKAKIQADRDAMLNSYSQQAEKRQMDFTAEQNRLTREQDAMQNQQQVALQAGSQAIAAEGLDINRQQAQQAAKKIDQDLEIGKFGLEQAKQLKEVRDQLVSAKTPEELDSAYDLYTRLTGDAQTDRYQATTIYGDENELGEQTRSTGILNTRTGKIEGVGATATAASQLETVPREEADADLLANPTDAARIKEYNEAFGAGAAEKLLQGSQPAAQPAAAQPASAGSLNSQRQQPAAPASDVLAGFTMPGPSVVEMAQESSRGAQQRNRQRVLDAAATDVIAVIDSNDLRKLARMKSKVDDALASGKLSDWQVSVLQAYLKETKAD